MTTFHFAKASFSAAAKICLIGILVHGNLLDDHSPRDKIRLVKQIAFAIYLTKAILMGRGNFAGGKVGPKARCQNL